MRSAQKIGLLSSILVLTLMGCRLTQGLWDLFTSPFVTALPESASEVQYHSEEIGIDWSFCLKARIPQAEFEPYLAQFPSLQPHSPDRIYTDDLMWLDWQFPCDHFDWWRSSDDLSDTYVHQEGDSWTMVKYEDGWLYVNGHSH